ncbi:MAG: hypothetical protein AAF694_00155 [Bacteroidota bacterium]
MFPSLPAYFRAHKLQADVRTLLLLRKALERGLVHTLGDLYVVLKGIITHDPRDLGPFTVAFYAYFLEVEIKPGESLDQAILRSQAFKEWRDLQSIEDLPQKEPDVRELIDQFLDEVHLTTFDIKKMLSGQEILNKDDPNQADSDGEEQEGRPPSHIDQAADYRDISLEELMERMKQVMEQQKRNHMGGSHWIGSHGISPYGNSGAAAGGIRVGGKGGGRMARAVVGDKNFYPVDKQKGLKDDNMDAALAALKGIEEDSAEIVLDIPTTIKEGLKNAGIFLPYEKENILQKLQVVLLIDNGGYSMSPYVREVRKLFSKMKTRFAHDMKTYYFHNTIYGGVYEDSMRTKYIPLDKLLNLNPDYSFFVVGDAAMAPYELDYSSQEDWRKLADKFKRIAWLNPVPIREWSFTPTTLWLKQIISMYTLTPYGVEKAVQYMNERKGVKG